MRLGFSTMTSAPGTPWLMAMVIDDPLTLILHIIKVKLVHSRLCKQWVCNLVLCCHLLFNSFPRVCGSLCWLSSSQTLARYIKSQMNLNPSSSLSSIKASTGSNTANLIPGCQVCLWPCPWSDCWKWPYWWYRKVRPAYPGQCNGVPGAQIHWVPAIHRSHQGALLPLSVPLCPYYRKKPRFWAIKGTCLKYQEAEGL